MYPATALYKRPVYDATEALAVDGAKLSRMASLNQLPEIVESGKWHGEDYALRMLWIAGSHALGSGIGYSAQIEAWKKIDFVVVASEYMSDTAKQASLALPVTMSFESEDYCGMPFMNQKAIEPVGESKTDFEIFVALADAMGYDDLYDKDAEGYLRELFDTEENIAAGVGYDDLHEQGAIYVDEIARVENIAVESNPTGRTQFYLEKLIPNGNTEVEVTLLDRLPYYEHAFEAYADNPLREKYPLFGVSYHDNYTGQAMHGNVPWLNEIRGFEGDPYIFIHETAAADRSIVTGDTVRVFNDRGSVVLRAVATKGIREDTINIPRGYESNELQSGHLQSLTAIDARDKISNNDSHNDWLCQVEKYEGGAQ
jgi:molybdopterin-containing oxidoreductase family molybdopterin binding subunit